MPDCWQLKACLGMESKYSVSWQACLSEDFQCVFMLYAS